MGKYSRQALSFAPFALFALFARVLIGCGDDTAPLVRPDASTPEDASGVPPPPALGRQLDRRGRPMIAELVVTAGLEPGPARDAMRLAYGAAGPADWQSFLGDTEDALAMYDAFDSTGIDGDGCGNQVIGPARSYRALASFLLDDRLYVDTATGQCRRYLSLETGGTDCGGLHPRHDAIDATYTALVGGSGNPISDGVAAHNNVTDVFPFLAQPRPSTAR